MRVRIDINLPESNLKTICLDDSCFFIAENNNIIKIKTKFEDRLNTLIALFGCKSKWSSNSFSDSFYKVYFSDVNEEFFCFDDTPYNWNMFMGYIDKLVGDSYDI